MRITVECGKSMWLQPSLGPVLPSCVRMTSSAEKAVDGVTEGEVRSETEKKGFFINVATVLPMLASVGHPEIPYWGQPSYPPPIRRGLEVQNG